MKAHFDIVVVGAGPSGLHAARSAASAGATVAVVDDNPRAGGQIWRQGPGHARQAPLGELLAELGAQPGVTLFASSRVIAPSDAHGLLLESAEYDALCVTYERLILATGARERLLPFAGWTLPGVTGAGALQALIKGGLPVRGERIVIAGSGPLLVAALATARDAGAHVLAVVEQASARSVAGFGAALLREPGKLWQAARLTRGFAGMHYWTGSMVTEAQGDGHVERVTIRRGEQNITLDCDRIACGFGLVPNITLAQALGCTIDAADAIEVDDAQRTSRDDVLAAGECTGIGGVELACVEGKIAGLTAVLDLGHKLRGGVGRGASPGALPERIPALSTLQELKSLKARWRRFGRRVETAFALQAAARTPPGDATLLCRCEDVSVGDVRAYADWRQAKLHTRCGMGACQGRICGTAASVYFGWPRAAPRPPFSPARIGTLIAGGSESPHSE